MADWLASSSDSSFPFSTICWSFLAVFTAISVDWLVLLSLVWISVVFSDWRILCSALLVVPSEIISIVLLVLLIISAILSRSFRTCSNWVFTLFDISLTRFAISSCFSAFSLTALVSSSENSTSLLIALHPPRTHTIRHVTTRKITFICSALSAGLVVFMYKILVITKKEVAPVPHIISYSFI